jgi:hypothetical protein
MSGAEVVGAVEVERQLLEPAVRADPQLVDALLADDFIEIGASGRVWTRDDTIAALAEEGAPLDTVTTSEWASRELAAGLALVRYVSESQGRRVRRTSLCRLENGQWRVFFHQGTPL